MRTGCSRSLELRPRGPARFRAQPSFPQVAAAIMIIIMTILIILLMLIIMMIIMIMIMVLVIYMITQQTNNSLLQSPVRSSWSGSSAVEYLISMWTDPRPCRGDFAIARFFLRGHGCDHLPGRMAVLQSVLMSARACVAVWLWQRGRSSSSSS